MDNEILWEVVLSYLGDGARAARTCKLVNVAARSRASRPFFLTAVHAGPAPEAAPPSPARLRSAAKRIGGFLLRQARRRLGSDGGAAGAGDDGGAAEEAPRGNRAAAAVAEVLGTLSLPAAPHVAVVLASGTWAGCLGDLRAAFRAALPATTIVGGAAPGVLCSTAHAVRELEPSDDAGGFAVALVRLGDEGALRARYVPARGDPHGPAPAASGRLDVDGDKPPRACLVFSEDARAAHAALREVTDFKDAWLARGARPCAVSGGLLGAERSVDAGSLIFDAAPGVGDGLPTLPAGAPGGALVLAFVGKGATCSSAVSRGAAVVGPHVYEVRETSQQRVNVCPGHSITLEKVRGLSVAAVRDGAGAFARVDRSDDLVSPGATLRTLVNGVGGLPRPLFLGVRASGSDGAVETTGFNLLSPQHLDDDGAVALDGDVPEGARAAWHTLDAAASVKELEAAAEASRVALRLAGARAAALRGGLDETLSVLGAIVFTCSGRGTNFHRAPDRDSAALRAGQPRLPIVGCFCNGEIGPPPFHEMGGGTSSEADPHIAGFTCSSVICRLDGADDMDEPETLLPPPPPPEGE